MDFPQCFTQKAQTSSIGWLQCLTGTWLRWSCSVLGPRPGLTMVLLRLGATARLHHGPAPVSHWYMATVVLLRLGAMILFLLLYFSDFINNFFLILWVNTNNDNSRLYYNGTSGTTQRKSSFLDKGLIVEDLFSTIYLVVLPSLDHCVLPSVYQYDNTPPLFLG